MDGPDLPEPDGPDQLSGRAVGVAALSASVPMDAAATAALDEALDRPRRCRARRDLVTEGQEIAEPLLILSGWAARVRILMDGRRQIVHFLLPGDLVGSCEHGHAVAVSTVAAINDVHFCVAPPAARSPALAEAYARGRAFEDAYLMGQIIRLGRLNAAERIADLLLELLERLERAGLAEDGRFAMPLTQEIIADALGLTPVHVNRTVQALRRDGELEWKGREVVLHDPVRLSRAIGRRPVRISSH